MKKLIFSLFLFIAFSLCVFAQNTRFAETINEGISYLGKPVPSNFSNVGTQQGNQIFKSNNSNIFMVVENRVVTMVSFEDRFSTNEIIENMTNFIRTNGWNLIDVGGSPPGAYLIFNKDNVNIWLMYNGKGGTSVRFTRP